MRRFSFIARTDGRIGLFSPNAPAQAFILDRSIVTESWSQMLEKGHGEIIPDNKGFEDLGMAFGEMSDSAWVEYVHILRKLDPHGEVSDQ